MNRYSVRGVMPRRFAASAVESQWISALIGGTLHHLCMIFDIYDFRRISAKHALRRLEQGGWRWGRPYEERAWACLRQTAWVGPPTWSRGAGASRADAPSSAAS